MLKFWKNENEEIFTSPKKIMGFSKESDELGGSSESPPTQSYLIKKFKFHHLEQLQEIKKELLNNKILIINADSILKNKNIPVRKLKDGIEDLKSFIRESGGSIGRIGEEYLILTPNSNIRIQK
ncbi:MAG: cell division protein SepF [Promethearchaeia archaeon]